MEEITRMSESRYPPARYDDNGKAVCRGCGAPLPKRRRSWCSDECRERHDPESVRQRVWARDKGICQMCGFDLLQERINWWIEHRGAASHDIYWYMRSDWDKCREIEFDHIIPFSEGGPTIDENMRVLCGECHKKRTAEWRASKRKNAHIKQLELAA